MKKVSRLLLCGALTLVLLTAACAGQEGSPTPAGTAIGETASPPPIETETTETAETAETTETAETGTASPEATLETTATGDLSATAPAATDTTETAATAEAGTGTPGIPVTGVDVTLVECQFCIEGMAQALLVIPDTATFETVADTAAVSTPSPDTGCDTVDTFNGSQIVMCRGEENTSLNLNVCTDGNNCTQVLVELQDCPDQPADQPAATATPVDRQPTNTPGVGVPTDTPGTGTTDTPAVLPTNSPNAGGG